MQSPVFCDECGAANLAGDTLCTACQKPLADLTSPASVTSTIQVRGQQQVMLQISASGPLAPGALLQERYHILEQIGEGGFGIVYKARDHRQASRLVAVKQIQLNRLSPREMIQATDSYNRETTLQPWLRHKGIPRIYEHFTDAENWYLVMDYIDGQTLEETLKRSQGGKLPVWEVLDIGIQLCDILRYLHQQEIIFRDVKPANIMRTARGRVYLIDFGIARRYDAHKRKDTTPLGSPGYASPEQYGTTQSTQQTDIYGLGATLLTLLTGKDLSECSVSEALADPRLPHELRELIEQMLKKELAWRIESILLVKWRLLASRASFPQQRRRDLRAFLLNLGLGSIFQLGYLGLAILYSTESRISMDSHIFFADFTLLNAIVPCLGLFLFIEVAFLAMFGVAQLRNPGKKWHGLGLLLGLLLSVSLLLFLHIWPLGWG